MFNINEYYFIVSVVFIVGSIVGSFLNVCIVRMPREESVIFPASHCPKCNTTIQWFDNIPLISYMFLLGSCRQCKEKFSIRYFFVELLTAFAFVGFYQYYGLSWEMLAYVFMASCFIVTIFVDFAHRIIPDEITVGGMCFGLLFSLMIPSLQNVVGPSDNFWLLPIQSLGWSLVGAFVGGGVMYLMGLLGDVLFKKETMGGGDIKLMAMIGAFLGWKYALLTFFLSPFLGSAFGLVEKVRTGDTTMAYGPFIVIAALVSLFYGDVLIVWILNGYSL